jgi:hypothetical protein
MITLMSRPSRVAIPMSGTPEGRWPAQSGRKHLPIPDARPPASARPPGDHAALHVRRVTASGKIAGDPFLPLGSAPCIPRCWLVLRAGRLPQEPDGSEMERGANRERLPLQRAQKYRLSLIDVRPRAWSSTIDRPHRPCVQSSGTGTSIDRSKRWMYSHGGSAGRRGRSGGALPKPRQPSG